jgi:hypothetical protein
MNEGFYIAQYLHQSRFKALEYIQMYRGRPCRESNLDRRRANPPLWPLGQIPAQYTKDTKEAYTSTFYFMYSFEKLTMEKRTKQDN